MITLKDIEERLKGYRPFAGNGDGVLNPGVPLSPVRKDAAVLILLVPQADGSLSIIFTERAKTLHAHAGQISFPGGGVEMRDKDAVETALREASEEIGLDPKNARVIGTLSEYVTRTGFRVTPVVAVLEKAQDWTAQPSEVARIFEVPVDFIEKNLKVESLTFEAGERNFYGMTYAGAHIWGATAGMLRDFLDAIKDSNSPPVTPPRKNDPPAVGK